MSIDPVLKRAVESIKGKHLTVCMMAYRGLEPPTVDCLVRDIVDLAHTCRVNYRRSSNDALVQRARSRVATEFFDNSDDEAIIMIDHDTQWAPGDVHRLLASCLKTKGIVGGIIAKRAFGKGIACRFPKERKIEIGADELIECTYVGSAFMCIHRDALKKMIAKGGCGKCGVGDSVYYPFFSTMKRQVPDDPKRMEELSEDWAICARAHDLKIPVHVDCWPKLVHIGYHPYTIADAFDQSRTVTA